MILKYEILEKYNSLFVDNQESIINDWLQYQDVLDIFDDHSINVNLFKEDFAKPIFDYYMGVINGSNKVGDCPVMGKYLSFLHEKNVMPDQLFMICTHFRKALIHLCINNNILCLELYDQLTYIIDHNLKGVLRRFREILLNKDSMIQKQTQLLTQYKTAIDASAIVSIGDKNGNILYANQKFCDLSGYTEDELMGQPHSIVRHEDMDSEVFKKMWADIHSKKSWQGIVKNRKKDGSSYYVDAHITPIFGPDGKIIEYFSIRHDLTEIFKLQDELIETQKEIIYKLGDLSESRSEETGYHVKRVAEYAKVMATLLDLDQEDIERVYLAAPMHDIGKIGTPDDILMKPGSLNDNEWEIMKRHAAIGYEIFKDSKSSLLQAAAIISHEHHEKWDGSGYPRGLKEDEAHIYARIIGLVDVFDALGSDRVYKKAWPLDKIVNYFKEQSGKHFDPSLVDLFLSNLDTFLEINKKYQND